jgi:hypothetical protein
MTEHAIMTPEQIADAVCNHSRARDVFGAGYEAGYLAGMEAAQLSQEQQAELAARCFYALELSDIDNRRLAKSAADFIEVDNARNAPGSAYIPRSGDSRYGKAAA